MSTRRHLGQGSRYQRQRHSKDHRNRGGPKPLSEALCEVGPDLALTQLFRSECSRCGDPDLAWFPGSDAVAVLGLARAWGVLAQLPAEYRQVAECWQCLRCGEFGAYGPSEWA